MLAEHREPERRVYFVVIRAWFAWVTLAPSLRAVVRLDKSFAPGESWAGWFACSRLGWFQRSVGQSRRSWLDGAGSTAGSTAGAVVVVVVVG